MTLKASKRLKLSTFLAHEQDALIHTSPHLCQGLGETCSAMFIYVRDLQTVDCGTCGISAATGHSPSYFLPTAAEPAQCSRPAAAGFHLPQHLEATAFLFGPLLRGQHALHLGDCLSQVAEASIYTAQQLQLRMLQSKYLAKETLIDCRIVCRLSHVKVQRSLTAAVVAAAVCHFPGTGL